MSLGQLLLDSAGALLVLLVLFAAVLLLRRRLLARKGGTFELSIRLRPRGAAGRGWVLGLGRYSGDTLEWFRIFSPVPRPRQTWSRAELHYLSHREPEGSEQFALYADHVVVTCATGTGELQLGMSPASLTGFQSWLEAGPPGVRTI